MGKINQGKLAEIKRLYYKSGLGMREISEAFNVSIGAVVYFMRRNRLKRRSFAEINKIRFDKKKPSFEKNNFKWQRERITGYRHIKELTNFWSKLTKIPIKQFTKPYIREDFKKEGIRKMNYGLIHIRYADKKLLISIKDLISFYKKKYG